MVLKPGLAALRNTDTWFRGRKANGCRLAGRYSPVAGHTTCNMAKESLANSTSLRVWAAVLQLFIATVILIVAIVVIIDNLRYTRNAKLDERSNCAVDVAGVLMRRCITCSRFKKQCQLQSNELQRLAILSMGCMHHGASQQ